MTRRAGRQWLAWFVWVVAATCLGIWLFGAGRWLVVEDLVDDPDAILVLASHEFERLPVAWQLAVRHPRAVVLLSTPVRPTRYNCQACPYRVGWLALWGIPRSRVHVMEAPVSNSYDEIAAAVALARERGWTSVQAVTSTYHTRRVATLVRHVLNEQVDVHVGVTGGSSPPARPALWWTRRYDGRYVVYEWAALCANGWRHGFWPWQWAAPTWDALPANHVD